MARRARRQRLALLAAVLLIGCRAQGELVPTVAPTATFIREPGDTPPPASPSPPTTPTLAASPSASPGAPESGGDAPAITPGPGTAIPLAIATGSVISETAPATELDPELERVIREHVLAHSPLKAFAIGEIAIEGTTIRVQIVPEEPAGAPLLLFIRAELNGYVVLWGPGETLTADAATSLGIPPGLIP